MFILSLLTLTTQKEIALFTPSWILIQGSFIFGISASFRNWQKVVDCWEGDQMAVGIRDKKNLKRSAFSFLNNIDWSFDKRSYPGDLWHNETFNQSDKLTGPWPPPPQTPLFGPSNMWNLIQNNMRTLDAQDACFLNVCTIYTSCNWSN